MTETSPGSRLVLLGGANPLLNRALAHQGDAALALGLLGRHPHVRWLAPTAAAQQPTEGRRGILRLLPRGVLWGTVQLAVTVVLLGLWRGRRLGPLVAEPLPVVVRSTETVEGRGRLLRAARARGTAAEALREAARARLADRLGTGPQPPPEALVAAISARSGRPDTEVTGVLYGPAPRADEDLVRLAAALDELEDATVRRQP